jgi:beta-1,4-N-acetylglucosaminyltransferase
VNALFEMFEWLILISVLLLFLRIIFVLRSIRTKNHPPRRADPMKTLVVLGSGGHTTEMLHLLKNLDPKKYAPLIYIIAKTDTTSLHRVGAFGGRQPDTICYTPRSREVGQSYVSSIATTLWSFLHAFGIVLRIRPQLLLCNGPGTCLPIAVVTLFFRLLGLCEGNIIFVESFCRVKR